MNVCNLFPKFYAEHYFPSHTGSIKFVALCKPTSDYLVKTRYSKSLSTWSYFIFAVRRPAPRFSKMSNLVEFASKWTSFVPAMLILYVHFKLKVNCGVISLLSAFSAWNALPVRKVSQSQQVNSRNFIIFARNKMVIHPSTAEHRDSRYLYQLLLTRFERKTFLDSNTYLRLSYVKVIAAASNRT